MSAMLTTHKRDGCSGSMASNFIPTANFAMPSLVKGLANSLLEADFDLVLSKYLVHEKPLTGSNQG